MSVINQMLRDLDARRGSASSAQLAALQSLGLVNVNRLQRRMLVLFSCLLALALLVATAYLVLHRESGSGADAALLAQPVFNRAPRLATAGKNDRVEALRSDKVLQPAPKAEPVPIIADIEHSTGDSAPYDAPGSATPTNVQTVRRLTPQQKAERWFTSAQEALDTDGLQQAESLLQKTLIAYPQHLAARTQLVSLLIGRQQLGEAERILANGLTLQPHAPQLLTPYAQLLVERGALQPALEALHRIAGEQDAETLALRAAILQRMKRHAESAQTYRQALLQQPHRALWWTGLGIALDHQGQPTQAMQAYRRAELLQLDQPVRDFVQQRIGALSSAANMN